MEWENFDEAFANSEYWQKDNGRFTYNGENYGREEPETAVHIERRGRFFDCIVTGFPLESLYDSEFQQPMQNSMNSVTDGSDNVRYFEDENALEAWYEFGPEGVDKEEVKDFADDIGETVEELWNIHMEVDSVLTSFTD